MDRRGPARGRPGRPDVTMTAAVPGGSVSQGVSSLEVRWILPGPLDMTVAEWFGRYRLESESREDAYLLDPDLGGMSVKIRAGAALEVKMFRGSPGVVVIPGRARGRLQYLQKWSFPLRLDDSIPESWRRIRKRRRIRRFSLTGGARCAVELTGIRTHDQDWWSLGFEATDPADLRLCLGSDGVRAHP